MALTGRVALLAVCLFVATACGENDTSSPVTTSGPGSTPTTATPGPISVGDLEVTIDDTTYSFPSSVCLQLAGDLGNTQQEARRSAQLTEDLAGRYASGWPTTTAVLPDQEEERAAEIRAAGIRTLVLADIGGMQTEVLDRWANDLSEGRAANIQSRLAEWQDGYPAVAAEVAEACFGLSY